MSAAIPAQGQLQAEAPQFSSVSRSGTLATMMALIASNSVGATSVDGSSNETFSTLLSDDDLSSALQQAFEGFFIVTATSVDPASSAESAWLAKAREQVAAESGDFAVALRYQELWGSRGKAEQMYLDGLLADLKSSYPYPLWTRYRCANIVVFIAEVSFVWFEPELPSEVRCEAF